MIRWKLMTAYVAVVVVMPALAVSLQADERFSIYANTGQFGWRLWEILDKAISTVPFYLERGNFRPGARTLEWAGHDLTGQFSLVTGLPINVSLGVVRWISVALLAVVFAQFFVRLIDQPNEVDQNRRPTLVLVGIAIGASFLISGMTGPVNLFAWLYLGSSALVVLGSTAITPRRLYTSGRLRRIDAAGFLLIGLLAASFNEYTAIIIPASLAVGIARIIILEAPLNRTILRLPAARAWLVQTAGFMVVFVPTRLIIASKCSANDCYSASAATITSDYPRVVAGRISSGFLPAQWIEGLTIGVPINELWSQAPSLVIWLVIALTPLGILMLRCNASDEDLMPFPVRTVLGVVVAFGGIILGTTLLFSTSTDLQIPPKPIGYPWRDSGLTTPAVSIIVAVLAVQGASRFGRVGRTVVHKFLLAGGLAVIALSFVTSSSVTDQAMTNQERRLNNQIALAAVEFEPDELGNSQRCQLLALWTATLNDQQAEFRPAQLERSLNEFVSYAHGATEFCTAEP